MRKTHPKRDRRGNAMVFFSGRYRSTQPKSKGLPAQRGPKPWTRKLEKLLWASFSKGSGKRIHNKCGYWAGHFYVRCDDTRLYKKLATLEQWPLTASAVHVTFALETETAEHAKIIVILSSECKVAGTRKDKCAGINSQAAELCFSLPCSLHERHEIQHRRQLSKKKKKKLFFFLSRRFPGK